ncbi:ABC transporter ATP-binding protein [Breznakiella homolactica]|uniref:ATP-binding cassette domain-containing protein n=1 Tax=Breznakiella homolactica TaxID=2798577 RepID=A0A7T8BA17_9SPIR|nr:oligopeptide/dipeptide ABC transporter ATP-binding protein [Breznakiella homolactica]QQO08901.1 ATP-binding cassette domain-containing protein [Breznakiella homolactica]
MPEQSTKKILEVQGLKKYFSTHKGELHAVDNVSFDIYEGKTLGVVGESGCGKTTAGRTILRLLDPTAGKVIFDGIDVTAASSAEMRNLRERMQIIFQDPYASLNPRMSVSKIIGEPLKIHRRISSKKELEKKVRELMAVVELADRLYNSYPHELDGGRRQRIGIARALALEPKFLVCDEPVSALDVSVQAQILNLMQDLQDKLGLTYMFVTHDMSVVKHISDDIAVMYLGQVVEKSPSHALFEKQLHPYTKALIAAIPVLKPGGFNDDAILKGEISSPIEPKPGCRFAPRCPYATEACTQADPPLREIQPNRFVACIRAEELA